METHTDTQIAFYILIVVMLDSMQPMYTVIVGSLEIAILIKDIQYFNLNVIKRLLFHWINN